jgi:hypothetical protein
MAYWLILLLERFFLDIIRPMLATVVGNHGNGDVIMQETLYSINAQ